MTCVDTCCSYAFFPIRVMLPVSFFVDDLPMWGMLCIASASKFRSPLVFVLASCIDIKDVERVFYGGSNPSK